MPHTFFLRGVSLYVLRAVLCGGFSYITGAYFICRKFVFHALCYLISGTCLTHSMQVFVGRFSNSIQCVHSCEEFLLYCPCCFMWEISLQFHVPCTSLSREFLLHTKC